MSQFSIFWCLIILLVAAKESFSQATDSEVVHKVMIYKKTGEQELKANLFYLPGSLDQPGKTAMALFHGGGWAGGSPEKFFETC
jgi:acetyl esterase/lipase